MVAGALACMALWAQPATAAEDFTASGYAQRDTAGFAGINIRLAGKRAAPVARIALGVHHHAGPDRPSPALRASTLELGFSRLGKPDLYVAGQRMTKIDGRLGLTPVVAALAVGGLAVAALAISELSDPDKEQCLLPEKELCK